MRSLEARVSFTRKQNIENRGSLNQRLRDDNVDFRRSRYLERANLDSHVTLIDEEVHLPRLISTAFSRYDLELLFSSIRCVK